MSAGQVYATFDNLPQSDEGFVDNRTLLCALASDMSVSVPFEAAPAWFGNMLQRAALSVSPYAEEYLRFCVANQLSCSMTGSGSAFFIACPTKRKADEVANLLNAQGFATRVCKTAPQGIKECH